MKVYEIREEKVHRGAQVYSRSPKGALILGGGSNHKMVPLFRKNPAEISPDGTINGRIMEAHPVKIHDGYALAKPNRESEQILVKVSCRAYYSLEGRYRRTGFWNFDCGTLPWSGTDDKVLMRATGPMDWDIRQDQHNVGWHDALVVLNVGDAINVGDENGTTTRAIYKSVKDGLIQL
jgi:hypothetical protein